MLEIIGIFAIIGGIIAAIAYYTESNKKSQRYYQARADVMQIVETSRNTMRLTENISSSKETLMSNQAAFSWRS